MNAVLREYLLKGVFLGLWAYLALTLPPAGTFGRVLAWGAGGLIVALGVGALVQVRRGYRPGRNLAGFSLLVLLDSPYIIYLGLVGGFAVGTFVETDAPEGREWLLYAVAGGAVLGYGLSQLRLVPDRVWRTTLGLVVGGLLTYLAVEFVPGVPALESAESQWQFAVYLLAGLPFFYLLTFCGEAEESEAEVAALFAVLGAGLYLMRLKSSLPGQFDKVIFLVPLGLYILYATRILQPLKVFKHTLRGYGNLSLGRTRDALVSFARALHLDRRNKLAADGMWRLMRTADISALDDATARLLPVEFCLDIAADLLMAKVPTPAERAEAVRMLGVVERQRPDLTPRTDYLRAVADAHAEDFDGAAATLSRLLDPATPYPGAAAEAARTAVLYQAWALALNQHPALRERLGPAELTKPGRRVDALRAVERHLTAQPEDPTGVELKRELYSTLTEAEFTAAASSEVPGGLNYDYLEQLGQAGVADADADPARVDRGMSYLRMAGRGLPGRGPAIFAQLADIATKLGRPDEAEGYLGQVKRAGLAAGADNLPADQKALYLTALQSLAGSAAGRGDCAAAVDDYRLYVESGKEDANTLRKLAELYARAGDPLNALLIVERGLLYAKADPDLLAKKDSYYYSVPVERIAAVKQQVAPWFDIAHCVKRARQVADQADADPDTLDYGLHLAKLARTVRPDSQAAMLAHGRLLIRMGELDAGTAVLEDLREQPRGGGDDEDAWFLATKILGDRYLDELGRPDLAAACYSDYRDYQRSGAETLYRLGQAHEAAGNPGAARKAYELVTAYPNHLRYWDATAAVRRLRSEMTKDE